MDEAADPRHHFPGNPVRRVLCSLAPKESIVFIFSMHHFCAANAAKAPVLYLAMTSSTCRYLPAPLSLRFLPCLPPSPAGTRPSWRAHWPRSRADLPRARPQPTVADNSCCQTTAEPTDRSLPIANSPFAAGRNQTGTRKTTVFRTFQRSRRRGMPRRARCELPQPYFDAPAG